MKISRIFTVIAVMMILWGGFTQPVQALNIVTSAEMDWSIGQLSRTDTVLDPLTAEVHSSVQANGPDGYSYGSDAVAACDTSCTSSCAGAADPEACHTTCMEDCLPQDTSWEACDACREDCNAGYTACGENCNDDLNFCKEDCNDDLNCCKEDCNDDLNLCKEDCNTGYTACGETCNDDLNFCKEDCNTGYTACGEDCNNVLIGCSAGCNTERRACDEDCNDTLNICKEDCNDTLNICKEDCNDTLNICYANCGVSCGDNEECLAICNAECLSTANTCFADCESDASACFPQCESDAGFCFNNCSSIADTCNTDCQTTADGCFEGCSPLADACEADCYTTADGCFEGCGPLADACEADCYTTADGCFEGCDPIAADCFAGCDATASACFDGCGPLADACFASCDPLCQGYGDANALGTEEGVLIVSATAHNFSLPGAEATTGNADVYWEQSFFNTSGEPQQYWLDFFIPGGYLGIYDLTDASSEAFAFFSIDISVNGSSVWNSSASLVGDTAGPQITVDGTGLDWTYSEPLPGLFSYQFDDYTGVLDVGTFNPGEEIILAYTMSVGAYAVSGAADFMYAGATIGDPFDLRGMDVDLTDENPNSVVPEPTTLIFVGSGIFLLIGFRRKFRK